MSHMKKSRLITAILPKGVSLNVISRLKKEKDVINANFCYGMGINIMATEKTELSSELKEREMLSVVVDEERADEIYEYVYHAADINKPHGGIMFMRTILGSEYVLPENIKDES